jgi:iron(III) transport system substrate-binding protein
MKTALSILTSAGIALGATFAFNASAADKLPANLKNDTVAKSLGAKIINAARKEGKLTVYGGTTVRKFFKGHKVKQKLQDLYGIKVTTLIGKNADLTQRIKTEHSVGRVIVDYFNGNEQYAQRFVRLGMAASWKPSGTELDNLLPWVRVNVPGNNQFFPAEISAQALMINTETVAAKDIPKSYWDLVNNPGRWKGKIAIRDPRAASGGAWIMMAIRHHPKLGLDYIKKLAKLKPSIVPGGSKRLRNVIIKKQFDLGFSGRGEFINDLPKGTPVEYIVPKEGYQWSRGGSLVFKKAPHPNAAKVMLTWFYQMEQLQAYCTYSGRSVAHPKIKVPVPQMNLSAYPAMPMIPADKFAAPNEFFKEMEGIFGIR